MVFFKQRKKGQLAIALIMFMVLVVILIVGAVMSSFGIKMTVASYRVGESLINSTQDDIDAITDPNIKASLQGLVDSAGDNTVEAVNIYSSAYSFSPIIAVIIIVLVGFLISRRSVETGQII